MKHGSNATIGNYVNNPHGLLLDLAVIAEQNGNERMRRVYMANYLRVTTGKGR